MRAPLTPIEREVYHFLLDFLAAHTYQPSVREIAAHFRIPSTKSVADLLASLERKGYVEREHGRSRGVTLVGFTGASGTLPVPVMRIEAGGAEPEPEDHVALDRRLVPADDAYLVRAANDDARAHGVRRGDLVVVHPSARAKDGDVMVVRVGGDLVVRAIRRSGATVVLDAPDGGAPRELGRGDDFAVLGVLSGVIRLPAPGADVSQAPIA